MIVLTPDEAEKVRGRSPKDAGRAIDPILLKDGRFMVGEEVLNDPVHDDAREFLASLPIEPIEKLPVYTPEDVVPSSREAALAPRTAKQAADRAVALEEKQAR